MAIPTASVVPQTITSEPSFSQTSELYQYLVARRAFQPTETQSKFQSVTVNEVTA